MVGYCCLCGMCTVCDDKIQVESESASSSASVHSSESDTQYYTKLYKTIDIFAKVLKVCKF